MTPLDSLAQFAAHINIWQALTLFAIGAAAGALGTLVGAGGGFILVPAMRLFAPEMEPEKVAGTAMALVAANGALGAFTYRAMNLVDHRSAYLFAAAAIPGSAIAPFALKQALSGMPGVFDAVFGMLLLAFAARLAYARLRRLNGKRTPRPAAPRFVNARALRRRHIIARTGDVHRYRFHETYAVIVNFGLGFVSSFFGIGGGFLRVPILVQGFRFPYQIAAATSTFSLVFYATAGMAAHLYLNNIEWFPAFACAAAGVGIGSPCGARLSGVVKGSWLLTLLTLIVTAMGAQLIIQTLT